MRSAIHTMTDLVVGMLDAAVSRCNRLRLRWALSQSQACEAAYVRAVAEYDAAISFAVLDGRCPSGLQVSRAVYADALQIERAYQSRIYRNLLNAGAFPVLLK